MGKRKDYSLNRVHFMNSLDKAIYTEFRNNCDALGRRYCDVHESLLSEWNDKAKVEIEKRNQKIEQGQKLQADSQLQGYLKSRLRDIDHRINSGLVTGEDLEREQRRKADTLKQLEELSQKITAGGRES
jgi:hypothetical protein